MAIGDVQNQESGLSARGKINESIAEANKVPDKMDKIPTAQNGNVAVFNAAGQVIDSGEQLGGGSGSNIPEWVATEIYPLDFVVQFNSNLFASKVASNQGNQPPLEGENTYWRETSASESTSTPLWAAGVYNKERAEVYVLDGLIYKKYVLTVTALPFESVDFTAELANGDWQLINQDEFFKGWYATPTALNTAHPTGEDGWWAIVGSTDTVWVWDSDTTAWVDTGVSGATFVDYENIFFEVVAPDNAYILRGFQWKVTSKTDYGGTVTITTSADAAYNLDDPVTAGDYLKASADTANARTVLIIQPV